MENLRFCMEDKDKRNAPRDREPAPRDQQVARLEASLAAHRRTEEQLRQLSRVFVDAADPIIIEDLTGTIIELNEEAARAYGWKRDELLGHPIKTLVPPERHAQADELLVRCKRGEAVRNVEGVR